MNIYDVIIIGGGPGGYTAALYATRAGLNTLILEKAAAGGQMALTHIIDNYPGFEEGIDGFELGIKMQRQAHRFGAKTIQTEVKSVQLNQTIKEIDTSEGLFYGKAVIIATGANAAKLNLEKEEQFIGAGVAYCAACDGMFYKNKVVAVVGGGNSAVADALLLSRIASKVILIHRRDTFRASKIDVERLKNVANIEIEYDSIVEELIGDELLNSIKIKNVKDNSEKILEVDGLFISIGRNPATELFKDQIELDKKAYIIADESTKTNIDGVFAVGDVRTKELRQVVTAVSDGAIAAHMAESYLNTIN